MGDSEGLGSLACCSPEGRRESDKSEQLNNANNLPSPPFPIWGRMDVSSDGQKRHTAEKIPSGRGTSQGHPGDREKPATGMPGGRRGGLGRSGIYREGGMGGSSGVTPGF